MTLAYDVTGSGPGLVLLHSTVCDRRMWDPQWDALRTAGFRVVRCDFRSYGETPLATTPYNEADDVVDVLDALGLESFAIVGASHGGRVAQEIAARWPKRVTKLVLVCSSSSELEPGPALGELWSREEAYLEAGEIDAAVELNVATFLGPEASEATREHVRAMQRRAFDVQLAAGDAIEEQPPIEVEFSLSSITAPSLVITGGRDLPEFGQVALRLAGLLPDTRAVHLPWAGHLPTLERPDELNALITQFLTD
jgi:3-oxoadipate enol-lactonase